MDSTTKDQTKNLEEAISRAIKKVRATKEFDLCKYIPAPLGGHIHHFTLKKMKTKDNKKDGGKAFKGDKLSGES